MPVVAAIPLLLIVGFLVAYGMSLTARSWTHALTVWVTRGLGVPNFLADRIVDGSIALTKLVTHELGRYAIPASEAVVKWLAGLAQYAALVGYWSLEWPKELFTFSWWLIHSFIPRVLHGTLKPIVRVVHGTVKVVKVVETRIVHVAKAVPATAKTVVIQTVPRTVREAAREIEWLRAHFKALELAIGATGAIAIPWAPSVPWGVTAKQIRRRLRRLEGRTVGLGAVALVAVALGRMGLGGLRCRNVKRAIRGICGANPAWLSLLFGAGAEAWIITHLCEFIAEVSLAAKTVQPELLQFVAIEDALIGCHGATKPKNLPLTWPAVPAVGEALTLSV